jgi:hypothetical protein
MRPSSSSKRPEQTLHIPVEPRPASSCCEPSRGGFPVPRHLPTSRIVIAWQLLARKLGPSRCQPSTKARNRRENRTRTQHDQQDVSRPMALLATHPFACVIEVVEESTDVLSEFPIGRSFLSAAKRVVASIRADGRSIGRAVFRFSADCSAMERAGHHRVARRLIRAQMRRRGNPVRKRRQ